MSILATGFCAIRRSTPLIKGELVRTVFNSFAGMSSEHAELELYA